MITQFAEGFFLGLATGTACLATCGPVYAPYLMQYERNILRSLLAILEISAGRFITYAAVGIVAGMLGSGIPVEEREWLTAISYLLFSAFLIITVFRTHRKEKCCSSGKWAALFDRPVLLGLFTGINICPSFLIALTKAVDLSGPAAGFVLFTAFFAGTSLFLLPLSFFGFLGAKRHFRAAARFSALIISMWFITQASITAFHQLKSPHNAEIDPAQILDLLDNSPAYVFGQDTTTLLSLRDQLSNRKDSPVKIVTREEDLPENGVIYIGQEKTADQHLENHPLRKAGRFIVILPGFSNEKMDNNKVDKLLEFFAFYQFKVDPDSGSIFQIPESVFN